MDNRNTSVDLTHISRVLREVVIDQSDLMLADKAEARGSTKSHDKGDACALASSVRDLRREAAKAFPGSLISDPAFDILLDLFISAETRHRRNVSEVVRAAGVASTTGLRWLARLEAENYVSRVADEFDRRQHFVALSEVGRTRMLDLFSRGAISLAQSTGSKA